jgi:hypothetical protein
MMTMVTAHQLDQDQDLLTEMRILSSLRPNDRITTNHATKPVVRIQQPSFFRPVYRLVGNESRISNIAYIQSLFQRLIDRFKAADRFSDKALVERLRTEAQATITGIRKLQQTYEDDAQFQAAMDVSVDTVCLHLGITPTHQMPVEAPAPAAVGVIGPSSSHVPTSINGKRPSFTTIKLGPSRMFDGNNGLDGSGNGDDTRVSHLTTSNGEYDSDDEDDDRGDLTDTVQQSF